MARIRTIKPEFFRSPSLARVAPFARLTFAGLWTEADDNGRGRADAKLLKGLLWPYDDEIGAHEVHEHLMVLAETGHIRLYIVDEQPYYQVCHWAKHQAAAYRRGVTLYPPPPGDMDQRDILHDEECKKVLEHGTRNMEHGTWNEEHGTRNEELGTRKAEGGRRKAETAADAAAFEAFWDLYPEEARRADNPKHRRDAKKAFRGIAQPVQAEVMAGLQAWCAHWKTEQTPLTFIPYPENFMRNKRWEDSPPATSRGTPRPSERHPPDPPAKKALREYRDRHGLPTHDPERLPV